MLMLNMLQEFSSLGTSTSTSITSASDTTAIDTTTTISTTTTTILSTTTPSTTIITDTDTSDITTTTDISQITNGTSISTEFPTSFSDVPSTTLTPPSPGGAHKFPYPIVMILAVWIFLALAYVISRWRQKGKNIYIIPRVFVLCSPRTVQYHYELILRVGLPSYDFNPDKHDIDLTVQGQQRNEVVPMTRLNTKTLLDEPLITSLSIIVYRLVEMPPLGGLILKHSGPFKSWLYAYDFTVIDLSTNKEQYYTLNQFIGSLNRLVPLDDPNRNTNDVHYPIDDVPQPQWTLENIYLLLYTVINCIMLSITLLPINCSYASDIVSIFLTAFGGGSLVFFLDWLLYYHSQWDHERREYFNEFETNRYIPTGNVLQVGLVVLATGIGAGCIYFAMFINDMKSSIVWLLAVVNSCTLVIGIWNVARLAEFGESIVALGLRMRGIEMVPVGMRYSEIISDIRTKSGSNSTEGGSTISNVSRISRFGPRSSVKSFGFAPMFGHSNRRPMSKAIGRVSSTGATPNNQSSSQIIRAGQHHQHGNHNVGGLQPPPSKQVAVHSAPKPTRIVPSSIGPQTPAAAAINAGHHTDSSPTIGHKAPVSGGVSHGIGHVVGTSVPILSHTGSHGSHTSSHATSHTSGHIALGATSGHGVAAGSVHGTQSHTQQVGQHSRSHSHSDSEKRKRLEREKQERDRHIDKEVQELEKRADKVDKSHPVGGGAAAKGGKG